MPTAIIKTPQSKMSTADSAGSIMLGRAHAQFLLLRLVIMAAIVREVSLLPPSGSLHHSFSIKNLLIIQVRFEIKKKSFLPPKVSTYLKRTCSVASDS